MHLQGSTTIITTKPVIMAIEGQIEFLVFRVVLVFITC